MSYIGKGWTSVEDLEKSLVSASKITQSSPPACVPPISTFNRRQNNIRGRGQLIIEQEKNSYVGFHNHRIAEDLRAVIPGFRGFSNTAIPEIISSCGQFDSDSDNDVEEPSFSGKKITSTPSTIGNEGAVFRALSPSSPSVCGGLSIARPPQDSVIMSGLNSGAIDQTNTSESLPDTSFGNLEVSTDMPETSSGQDTSYRDPFYYTFDDSVYAKADIPITDVPTPSPCSSPLPHHLTVDEQYVSCVQVESDSSSSPSLIFDSDIADGAPSSGIAHKQSTGRVLDGTDEPSIHVSGDSVGKGFDGPLTRVPEESPYPLQNVSINTVPCKTRPEMFEDYLKFCRLVRNLIPSQPEVYDGFLALLDCHKEEKVDEKSVVESASILFRSNPELVENFKKLASANFSPSLCKAAGTIVAKNAPKKVGNLSGSTRPRRCRNALILNLLKKEAISEDPALADELEMKPSLLESNVLHTENDLDKKIESGGGNRNNDMEEAVFTHSLDVSTHTALGYITANAEFGDVSFPVLDSTNISEVLCPVDDIDGIQDPVVPLCDFVSEELNSDGVPVLDGVGPLSDATGIDAASLPTTEPLQNKPLELLKPEDIIPETQNPISHLEIAHEIASSVVDPIVTQGVVNELIEVENDEGCPKSDIELLKPSDFVHLGHTSVTVDETVNVLEESSVISAVTILDPIQNLTTEESAVKDSSESMVLCSDEDISIGDAPGSAVIFGSTSAVATPVDTKPISTTDELNKALFENGDDPEAALELLKPSDFVHSEPNSVLVDKSDYVPLESVVSPAVSDSDSVENSTVEKKEGVMLFTELCSGGESKSDDAVPSSAGMESIDAVAIETYPPSNATYEAAGYQVETTCYPIPLVAVEIEPVDEIEQKLSSVVVAMAKMDLNTDTTDRETESSGGISPNAIPLPPTADSSLGEIVHELTQAEVTMTVRAIPSLPQTLSLLDADGAADPSQQNGSSSLLRPDQFVNLTTAVDPHQDQQALQKHSKDLNSLD